MTAYLDTNVVIRHLTGSPPEMAAAACEYLAGTEDLLLTDLIVAECVYVLSSVYGASRVVVAESLRAVLAFPRVLAADSGLLLRALELFETRGLHFPEAYLVACAEVSGVLRVASFDRAISRIEGVERIEPRSA